MQTFSIKDNNTQTQVLSDSNVSRGGVRKETYSTISVTTETDLDISTCFSLLGNSVDVVIDSSVITGILSMFRKSGLNNKYQFVLTYVTS